MKKVLLISFEYPIGKSYCGGVGQIVKQCRKALLATGCQVYVLISGEFIKKQPVKLLLPDDSVIRYPNFRSFQKKYDWCKFDYIIQHFVNWTDELKKLKRRRGFRPKIVYHFHSILRREKDSGFKTLNRFLLNQEEMIKIADKIICPSLYEYDNFMRYFPYFGGKVSLLVNTIEAFPFQKEKIRSIKSQYRIKGNDIISIYVGRLEKIKGADILIKNIPKVLRKHRKLKIFIIGKVLERNIYRKLASVKRKFGHQLFYIKYLEKHILFQFYYLSDIYINTSLSESFSLSTYEAALCDNALLLNCLPVFDKFKNSALFFNMRQDNGAGLISQYERLIRSKRLRARLSNKAVRVAKKSLSNGNLNKRLFQLLKASDEQ